jgi:outer membrane protein assembly factor BamA
LLYTGNYPVRIDSIKVKGNKITQKDVIFRELTFSIGDTVTKKILNYNLNRIYSLDLFTKVELNVKETGNKNVLIINVEESWYIYPIPFIELEDRNIKKLSYGIDFFLRNFRGENESIRIRGALGYDPTILLYYERPYLIRKENINFSGQVFYQNASNKSDRAAQLYGGDFRQKFIGGYLDFGKRFNIYNKADFQFGYYYIESPRFFPGISASGKRIDHEFTFGISYLFDTRDLAQFPSVGTYAFSMIQFKGLGIDNINYQVVNFDFREYFRIFNELRVKGRFTSRLAFGKLVPYYDYSFIGYQERIRGHYNQIEEGDNYYLGSFELNYPIIKDVNVNLDFLPIIPRSLLSYRFAFYMELFMDTGTTMMNNQRFNVDYLKSGYGAGLIFLILPYNILRIEYALGQQKHSEWILGLGLSF